MCNSCFCKCSIFTENNFTLFQMNKFSKIAFCVFLCVAVGFLSSLVTRDSVLTWFPTQNKPFFNPPSWVFAPVWTLLYIGMGVAAGLVWNEISTNAAIVKKALIFFAIQLVLNAFWSYIFFGLHNPLLALVDIVLLWLFIFETYKQFKNINKLAGYLFIPYLAWVSFATLLNASIWWLNR